MKKWSFEVHHIYAGQGDAALLLVYSQGTDDESRTLEKAVLVDVGPSDAEQSVLKYLQASLCRQQDQAGNLTYKPLDAIVITHYDVDHVGSFRKLLENSLFHPFLGDEQRPTALYDVGDQEDYPSKYKLPNEDAHRRHDGRATVHTFSTPNGEGERVIKRFTTNKRDSRLLGVELLWRDLSSDLTDISSNLTKITDMATADRPKKKEKGKR